MNPVRSGAEVYQRQGSTSAAIFTFVSPSCYLKYNYFHSLSILGPRRLTWKKNIGILEEVQAMKARNGGKAGKPII